MAKIKFGPDFKEFLRLLNCRGTRYLLVGGYAVAFHGRPRSTGDIDLWIDPAAENASKVIDALVEFGFADADRHRHLLVPGGKLFRLGVPPNRIEVLPSVSGLEFAACWPRRVDAMIDGTAVHVLGLEDLRTNKKAAGRAKDLADLDDLP
jgi:predicted nucleotidyltransferase